MTDTTDLDRPDTAQDDAVDAPSILRDTPSSVADALDLHMRLTALSRWVGERKGHVAEWLKAKGEARLVEDGAAPTWRLPDGMVLLTDPDVRVTVEDPDRLARWYVVEVLGLNPDAVTVLDLDGRVERRRRASCDEKALVEFHDAYAELESHRDPTALARVASWLNDAVRVTTEWVPAESLVDDLITGKAGLLADEADLQAGRPGRPCVVLDREIPALVTVDGVQVPGVRVHPPNARSVQVKPSADAKRRVAGELERLLGRPVLEE